MLVCIIRSRFLQKITDAYNRDADLANLLLDEYFLDVTAKYQQAVRDIVALAVQAGVPVPTFSAAITYFDSYRSADLPANLIQAQRDCWYLAVTSKKYSSKRRLARSASRL